jgi:hypothetical protein
MSESRVRENRMHGSIGGRWRGRSHGVTESMHLTGKPAGLSPSDLPELLNQRPTSLLSRY